MLQHTDCNTLQHISDILPRECCKSPVSKQSANMQRLIFCITLQQIEIQHTASHMWVWIQTASVEAKCRHATVDTLAHTVTQWLQTRCHAHTCDTLQHTDCKTLHHTYVCWLWVQVSRQGANTQHLKFVTHRNTPSATHCNTQLSATHCNTQLSATHCNTHMYTCADADCKCQGKVPTHNDWEKARAGSGPPILNGLLHVHGSHVVATPVLVIYSKRDICKDIGPFCEKIGLFCEKIGLFCEYPTALYMWTDPMSTPLLSWFT